MGTYANYYAFIRNLESGYDPDPRARGRAQGYAWLAALPIIVIAFELGSLAAIHASGKPFVIEPPWMLLIWASSLPLDLAFGKAPAIDVASLWRGWLFVLFGIILASFAWTLLYSKYKDNRDGLPGVTSRSHWQTPEELAEIGLLPRNYDVHRGFRKSADFDPAAHLRYSRDQAEQLKAEREAASQ